MIPFKRRSDQAPASVVLDTSGLIDGRVVQIVKAGFVPQAVVVPQFVIAELQFLADHGDTHKRERARYGLDVIRELQDVRRVEVTIAREKFENIREVDDKLVALAKQYGSFLYTTDFNLNKVAQIEGVQVLNVNELAHALRPNLLPGERVAIKLTQVGQDRTQGVGYLGDGTMVVVEQAGRFVGHQVQAVCTRILQTQAGKMMFATLATKPASEPKPKEKSEQRQAPQLQPAVAHVQPRQSDARQHQQPAPATRQQRSRDSVQAQSNVAPSAQQQASSRQQNRPVGSQRRSTAADNTQRPAKAQTSSSNAQNKQPRQRPARRRLSPEDSLIATLKEIQD